MLKLKVMLMAVVFVLTGNCVFADVLNLTPQSDAYVYWDGLGNYTTHETAIVPVGHYPAYYNSLIKFDLSALPSSAAINSATLSLNVYLYERPTGSPIPSFSINKIAKDWNENSVVFMGANGGANNIYYNNPDGSFGNNGFFVQNPIISYQPDGQSYNLSFNLTSTAQEWMGGNNFGILLKDEYAITGHEGDILFWASEAGADYSPKLSLNYTPNAVPEPVSTVLFLLGGATMAVRRLRRK